MNVAIVIPAFNEAATIGEVVRRVLPYGQPFVVDDGSSDETGTLAAEAGARVCRHPQNRGYDPALATGFAAAAGSGAEVITTIDADGQLDANALPIAIEILASTGAAMILGTRPKSARFAEDLFNLYTRVRFHVPDILCGLKAFRTEAYQENRQAMDPGGVFTGLALALLRRGAPFELLDVAVAPRDGQSRFGGTIRGNARMLRALARAMAIDMRENLARR